MMSVWQIPYSKNKELEFPNQALIGLGSSLGSRASHLRMGIIHLKSHPQIRVSQMSSVWQTPPLGNAKHPFLNMCLRLQTTLLPQELLDVLLKIELKCQRIRGVHWMDRTLDLDLLLYDQEILSSPSLKLPHPRMLERSFVMIPAIEVAGDMVHPILGRLLSESDQTSNLGMWAVGRFVFVKV